MAVTRSSSRGSRTSSQHAPAPAVGDARKPDHASTDPVVAVTITYERSPVRLIHPLWVRHLFTAWMWVGAVCTYGVCVSGAVLCLSMFFLE